MKKLLTMLSAATVALGLYAYDNTGTSFEGGTIGAAFDIGTLDDIQTNGVDVTGLWATNGTPTLTVEAAGVDSVSELRPSQFEGKANSKCLRIQSTFGNPVDRNIKDKNIQPYTQEIGDGFYFDSLVKFTAFDGDVPGSVTNEMDAAKIAVWLQTNEDETQTNLYVRAGQFVNSVATPHTYGCGEIVNPDGWHRLTIKAIANISDNETPVPAFMVFVDGTAVSISDGSKPGTVAGLAAKWDAAYNNEETLFPSMVQGINGTNLESVSFDGTGWIDDVVFTETAPDFAVDPEPPKYVTITWDAGVESVTIDNQNYTEKPLQILFTETTNITVTANYANGKMAGTWEASTGATLAGTTFTFTAENQVGNVVSTAIGATFAGVNYPTVADAIDAANAAGVADQALVLFGTVSETISIDREGGNRIKIDLNGQTVNAGIEAETAVWLVDSVGDGKVEGYSYFAEGSLLEGGAFNANNNTAADLNVYDKTPGYEFVESDGYLVLQQLATVTVTVTGGANATAVWTVNNAPVAQAPATLTQGQTYSVEFTANTDYKFEGSPMTVFNGTVGTEAIEIAAPNAVAKVYYTAVSLNKNATSIETNLTETLTATFTPPSAADDTYTWASSAPAVATVDQNGVVTAVAAGTATISVTATHDPLVTASCTVTVTASSSGWVVDPTQIPENTSAATQYPALADSALATADARKLTTWAKDNSVAFDTLAANAGDYTEAFLLDCAPADVATEKAAFKANITISFENGVPVVEQTTPGTYNGTLKMMGSNDLSDWRDVTSDGASSSYKFYKYELSL